MKKKRKFLFLKIKLRKNQWTQIFIFLYPNEEPHLSYYTHISAYIYVLCCYMLHLHYIILLLL